MGILGDLRAQNREKRSRTEFQAVAVASCACRQWRDLAQHRELWRAACLEVFHREGADEIERECLRMHRCSHTPLCIPFPFYASSRATAGAHRLF